MTTCTPLSAAAMTVCELSPELAREEDDHASPARALFPQEVVDRLLNYGRTYHERRQARIEAFEREQARAEEVAKAERLAARHEHIRTYHELNSAEELAAHRRARAAREADRQRAWQEEAARQAPCQPTLTPRSVALAARRREKEGLSKDLSASEVQARRQAAAEKARQDAQEAWQREQAPRGAPVISARARTIQHTLPAFERLYRHARESQHDETLAGIERQLREVTNIMKTSKPRLSAKAAALPPREVPVYEQLYAKAAEKLQQRERLASASGPGEELFHPKVDPTSELLTRQMPGTAAQRLYGGSAQRQRPLVDPRAAHMTFAPHINPAPRPRVRSGESAGTTVEARTRAWDSRRAARLRAQAAEREAEEARQCTFRPTITARAARYGSEAGGSGFSRRTSEAPSLYTDPMVSPRTRMSTTSLSQHGSVASRSSRSRSRSGKVDAIKSYRYHASADRWACTPRASQSWTDDEEENLDAVLPSAVSPWESRDELMRIAYEALAEADAVSADLSLDHY